MAKQVSMGDEARRRRARKVEEKVGRLERVENALLLAQVEIPKLVREIREARRAVLDALRPLRDDDGEGE